MSDLSKIKEKFSLGALETMNHLNGGTVLRFRFMALSDEGMPLAKDFQFFFEDDIKPDRFTNSLREIADIVDSGWEKSFPTAVGEE